MHDVPERAVAGERDRDGSSTWPVPALGAPAEEVEPVVDVGDRCLLWREREPHLLCHELGRLLLDRLGVVAGTGHQNQEVVRVADEPVGGMASRPMSRSSLWSVVRLPGRLEATVED